MGFSSRRGRPRTLKEEVDQGTPELRQKRRHHLTTEPVDYLLQKGLITDQQHRCALHFRWLYTLRYGTVTITAIDPSAIRGRLQHTEDLHWREAVEKEWKTATQHLSSYRLLESVMRYCIYDTNVATHTLASPTLNALQSGLEALVKLWHRKQYM